MTMSKESNFLIYCMERYRYIIQDIDDHIAS